MASSPKPSVITTVSSLRRTVPFPHQRTTTLPQSLRPNSHSHDTLFPAPGLSHAKFSKPSRENTLNQLPVPNSPEQFLQLFFFLLRAVYHQPISTSPISPAMPSAAFLRLAARGSATFVRASVARPVVATPLMARSAAVASFSTSVPRRSEHAEETFEEFTAR